MPETLHPADIEITLRAQPETEAPRYYYADQEQAAHVAERARRGDLWAWFTAKVSVRWGGYEGADHLGACSYESEADFRASGYYQDMVAEAFGDALRRLTGSAKFKQGEIALDPNALGALLAFLEKTHGGSLGARTAYLLSRFPEVDQSKPLRRRIVAGIAAPMRMPPARLRSGAVTAEFIGRVGQNVGPEAALDLFHTTLDVDPRRAGHALAHLPAELVAALSSSELAPILEEGDAEARMNAIAALGLAGQPEPSRAARSR